MIFLIAVGLAVASIWDWKFRKIPNWLTFSLICIAFSTHFYFQGFHGLMTALAGLSIGLALLYLPFTLGGMGGGDVKLLGAIGAFVGPYDVFRVFLAATVTGGFICLFEMVRHRRVKTTLSGIKNRLVYLMLRQRLASESEITFNNAPALYVPYALILSSGYLWLVLWGGG